MTNRAERRAQRRTTGGGYRPPGGLEYNEYVGELWPPKDGGMTEVCVRYGVRDNQYLDWSITANVRIGDLPELRHSSGPLERRKLIVVDVSDSAIRRHVFDPNEPSRPPQISRIVELQARDYDTVNYQYQHQLSDMCLSWQRMHPEIVENHDRHNTAFINFMTMDRDRDFREGESFGWVRNTIVCLDTDLADLVIADRAYFYFPTSPSTAGVAMSDGPNERMKFIRIDAARPITDEARADRESEDGPIEARGDTTMGMLVDSIYSGDWVERVDELDG